MIALETSHVWLVRREVLLSFMDKHPLLMRQVLQDFAGRIMHLIQMVEDLSLRSGEARLARLLLEQARDQYVQRRRWATQAEMAARLGSAPDVVNRALRKLVELEFFRVERHQIQTLDQDGLRIIAQVID